MGACACESEGSMRVCVCERQGERRKDSRQGQGQSGAGFVFLSPSFASALPSSTLASSTNLQCQTGSSNLEAAASSHHCSPLWLPLGQPPLLQRSLPLLIRCLCCVV